MESNLIFNEEDFIKYRVMAALDEYIEEPNDDKYDELLVILAALNDYYIGNRK